MIGKKIEKNFAEIIIFEFYRYFRTQPYPKHKPTWLAQESRKLPYQYVNRSMLQDNFLIKNDEQVFIYFERKENLYFSTGENFKTYFSKHDVVDTLYDNCEFYVFNKSLKWCIVIMDHPSARQALFRLIYYETNFILKPIIELEENQLIQIFNSLKKKGREKIVLPRRLIQKIPSTINHLENIIYLDLSYNYIQILPEETMQLPLQVLKISANPLKELPKNFPKLGKTLEELHLSGVKLSNSNWELLSHLENLQKLYISYNGLTEIPLSIMKLKKLKVLDISFNLIKNFSLLSKLNLDKIDILGNP